MQYFQVFPYFLKLFHYSATLQVVFKIAVIEVCSKQRIVIDFILVKKRRS